MQVDWIGSLGGVRYRAPYDANNGKLVCPELAIKQNTSLLEKPHKHQSHLGESLLIISVIAGNVNTLIIITELIQMINQINDPILFFKKNIKKGDKFGWQVLVRYFFQ